MMLTSQTGLLFCSMVRFKSDTEAARLKQLLEEHKPK
jgi:hypothetical protein